MTRINRPEQNVPPLFRARPNVSNRNVGRCWPSPPARFILENIASARVNEIAVAASPPPPLPSLPREESCVSLVAITVGTMGLGFRWRLVFLLVLGLLLWQTSKIWLAFLEDGAAMPGTK